MDGSDTPLQNKWSFWKGPTQIAEDYDNQSLKELCHFDTVQTFWECFNSLPPVKKLLPKYSYHLMKKGVEPLWEDPENVGGGFWTLRISKKNTDVAWRELVFAIIGEHFASVLTKGDDIMGITVSIRCRDNDIVQIWNKKATGNTTKIWEKTKLILNHVEITNKFYKACSIHKAFSEGYKEK
eukprot:TRINITY_DN3376_c0_g1_i2.p1 TRINITY_DN3376_c0_g1~~TRINITY_DN3376_c0_g1_i2.p1  ORF type:complete len:182 (-),score=25.99 TRINITY_DN3376_c0_g1_i2:67-612(-)